MVQVTRCLLHSDKVLKVRKGYLLDSLRIYIRGGAGGPGLAKYGGIGGKGGDVIVSAAKNSTLRKIYSLNPSKRFVAKNGDPSSLRSIIGHAGAPLTINVPIGICVQTDTRKMLADLNEVGQSLLVATGGVGGNPVNNFTGARGEARMLRLELKLLADIGLVGFPNAGKSTFLSAISRATPKIANYPFTTLRPQIGVMGYEDHRQITVADLPGLIEGAHINIGLGHKFLKHVERTKLLLFMVDVNGFQLRWDKLYRSAFETVILLIKELELYRADLIDKPAILAINKVDGDADGPLVDELIHKLKSLPDSLQEVDSSLHPRNFVQFDEIVPISAKYGHSVDHLKQVLRGVLDYHADSSQRTLTVPKTEDIGVIEKSKDRIV